MGVAIGGKEAAFQWSCDLIINRFADENLNVYWMPDGGHSLMRSQVLNSVKWLGLARLIGQVVAVSISVIVVRLLDPADYGVMAVALVFLGLILLLNELGMGAALVQQEHLENHEIERVFGLLLIVNLALYALVYLTAPSIASFFKEPRITPIIQVVALRLPLIALVVIPRAMLQRGLKFRALSMVDLVGMVTASLGTLVLALLGFGVWALACGVLFGAVVEVVGMYMVSRFWVRPRFSLRGMRRQATFGGYLTLDRLIWYTYTRADAVIVGRLIGNEALGLYYIAKKFAGLPVEMSGGIFTQVGFAAYSRIQHDMPQFRLHYRKVARMASAVSFPVCFGLSAVAPEAVPVILGSNWVEAVVPMQLIALVTPLRQLNALNTPALLAVGRPEIALGNVILAFVIMPAAFAIGANWGLPGVATAWAAAYPVYFLLMLMRSLPVLGVSYWQYLDSIWPPVVATVAMYALVEISRLGLQNAGATPFLKLALSVVVGVASYIGLVLVIRNSLAHELVALFRRERKLR